MDKCRICLQSKRTSCSIFETDQGLSYASMLTIITGIKIVKNEFVQICLFCRRKLKDLYEFKRLIERSELELSKQCKVFRFSTIDDIKVEFLTDLQIKKVKDEVTNYEHLFQNPDDCIFYNNTVIKRLYEDEKKTIPIEQFLSSIKLEEVDDSFVDDEYTSMNNYKRKKKPSKRRRKRNPTGALPEVKNIRIQPVFLKDVKVLKSPSITKRIKPIDRSQIDGTLCPFCGKLTKHLRTHILIHSGERRFKCDKCQKSFYILKHLESHMKSHSTPTIKQTFKCEHCISTFSTKGGIVRHMATHFLYKQFSCLICEKEFKWKNGLKRHMLIHDMTAKSVQCNTCKMTFYSRDALRRHTRVHTGERPYKCELCSQPYSYKRDFNRHCLKKHGVIVDRRPIKVMNEEVLQKEKVLMKDLMLRLHGIPTETEPMDAFFGPQKAQAFAKAVKVMQNGQIPIDVHL